MSLSLGVKTQDFEHNVRSHSATLCYASTKALLLVS